MKRMERKHFMARKKFIALWSKIYENVKKSHFGSLSSKKNPAKLKIAPKDPVSLEKFFFLQMKHFYLFIKSPVMHDL